MRKYLKSDNAFIAANETDSIVIMNSGVAYYSNINLKVIKRLYKGTQPCTKEECEAAFNKVVQNLKEKI